MVTYKNEVLKIPYKLFRQCLDEAQMSHIDELFNARTAEGFELAAHSFMTGGDVSGCILLATFKKEE